MIPFVYLRSHSTYSLGARAIFTFFSTKKSSDVNNTKKKVKRDVSIKVK
jgi:hypothetical protein